METEIWTEPRAMPSAQAQGGGLVGGAVRVAGTGGASQGADRSQQRRGWRGQSFEELEGPEGW